MMRLQSVLLPLASLAFAAAASAVGPAYAHVQEATPAPATTHATVPLKAFTCVVAHPGDWVTMDWNPGFSDMGLVHGIGMSSLGLAPLFDNGQIAGLTRIELGGLHARVRTGSLGNGYFHFEFALPGHIRFGDYLVATTTIHARMADDYDGPSMEMTNDPRHQHFCITIVQPTGQPTQEAGR